VITVNDQRKEIDRRPGQASYYRQELSKGVFLDMVSIPGGTFWMGTAEGEITEGGQDYQNRIQNERPRHAVMIEPFYMGKFAVTQVQWIAIANLPKVNRDLKPDPSYFKGDHRPVENVSWEAAIEFCDRLNRKSGGTYRLPSEAEWEYACRAGTTPFHFGETITPELANYYYYAKAPKGTYQEQTINVGSFPPNAFGLYDMHGNIWEWCADPWHENYKNAPADGRVWEVGSNQENVLRVLRGGAWDNTPRYCRSAIRVRDRRGIFSNRRGFRLVSFPHPSPPIVRTRC
jgi:formylglycine-generating enzyme required for sulfatase activity